MAFARRPRRAAQCDAMIERDVIADLRGLADDHASAVINEEPVADLGARMNVDIGQEAAKPRQQPRRKPPAGPPQTMRDAMPDQRVNAGIGQQGFQLAAGGGIAQADAADVLLDQLQQRRTAAAGHPLSGTLTCGHLRHRTWHTSRAIGKPGIADLAPDARDGLARDRALVVDGMLANAGENPAQLDRNLPSTADPRATR